MSYRIPYGGALIGPEEKDAINRIVERDWWPMAEEGDIMEKEAAEYLGVKYGVLANSGSSAGLLALKALELRKGSEVIIPAVTFPTIFNIILQCGLKPVVVDCEIGTYNINLESLEKMLSRRTKAVIAVHAVGNPADMPAILDIVRKRKQKIYVIEDNCDGWGGTIDGKKLGAWGDVSITSFHAAHIVAMGQGGGVFTDDYDIAHRAKMYRDWGRQANITGRVNYRWDQLPRSQDPRFIYEKIGFNLLPLELQAAMGRVQLRKTEDIKAKRRINYEYLRTFLSRFPELVMPKVIKGADPSWFAFPLTYSGDRGKLTEHLENAGIETRSMFAGNILKHPAYTGLRVKHDKLDGSDYILEHSFWVGVHPRMTQEDREFMVKTFADFLDVKTE